MSLGANVCVTLNSAERFVCVHLMRSDCLLNSHCHDCSLCRCADQGWTIQDICARTERTYKPAQFLLGDNDADAMQEMEDVSGCGRGMLFGQMCARFTESRGDVCTESAYIPVHHA